MRRTAPSWTAVALVAVLLAAGVGAYVAGAHEAGIALLALATGLVTPLRLAATREEDEDARR